MKTLKSLMKFREFPPNARKFIIVKVMERLSLQWMGPIYTVYMTAQGMELWQVMAANMIFMFLKAAIDPPTGNLGDRVGHVRVYLWGLAVMVLSTFTYSFASTFWFVVFAESIGALGAALLSEAMEAWLYKHEPQVVARRAKGYAQSIGGILGLLPKLFNSAILVTMGLRGPWLVTSGWFALTFISTAALVRNGMGSKSLKTEQEDDIVQPITLSDARRIFFKSWRLKAVFIAYFVMNMSFQPLNMFWGEYVRINLGMDKLGWIYAVMGISMALGSSRAGRLESSKINLKSIALMCAITAIFVLLSGGEFGAFLVVSFFVLHESPRLLMQGTLSNFANLKSNDNPINETNRATFGSILSVGLTLGAAFGLLVGGIFSMFLTIQEIWVISGIELVLLSLIILFFSYKYEKKSL